MPPDPYTASFLASQLYVSPKEALRRLHLARAYIRLTRAFADVAFPGHGAHMDLDMLLVVMAVGIGDGDGRPMNATKIAHYTGIPRATVQRKLGALVRMGKIARNGNVFRYAANGMRQDRRQSLEKAVAELCGASLPPKMGAD